MNKIRFLLLIVLLSLISLQVMSQARVVKRFFKGEVVDSASAAPLPDVTVSIYNAKDTSLINFAFTTSNGNYDFQVHNRDSLLLVFSAMGYKERIISIKPALWDWDYDTDRKIKLIRSSSQLKEVTISTSLIYMKGDTIEINAKRLKVLPNSDVSQLFKRIPGFEVDRKGNVKVDGNEVSKIVVDGSDFFGNNPALVSKNLRADMVDKVQVYDDKDENGELAINHTKTINLKLKKSKRGGLFGDALAGYGTNKRYEGGLRLNSFKNDRKFSFISNSNNTNDNGFDFGFDNYHGGSEAGLATTMSRYINYYNPFDESESTGLLNTKTNAAFSYFNEFSGKRKLSGNIGASTNNFNSTSKVITENPLSQFGSQKTLTNSTEKGLAQLVNGQVDFTKAIDSIGIMGVGMIGAYNKFRKEENYSSQISQNDLPINSGTNQSIANNLQDQLETYVNFNVRHRKYKNLTLTFNLNGKWRGNSGIKQQYTNNTTTLLNVKNDNQFQGSEQLANLSFTVPVYKNWRIGLRTDAYSLSYNNDLISKSAANVTQYDISQNYPYELDTLSIHFYNTSKQYNEKLFAAWNSKKETVRFNFGLTAVQINMENGNRSTNFVLNKSYQQFLPVMRFSIRPKNEGFFLVIMEQAIDFPKFNQLMPVQNLANPWYRLVGNPGLLPFMQNHAVVTFAKGWKGFVKHIWTNLDIRQSDSYHGNLNTIKSNGITYSTPQNLSGYFNANLNVYSQFRITNAWTFKYGMSGFKSIVPQLFNGIKNMGNTFEINTSPGIQYTWQDKLEFNLDYNWSFSSYKNDLNTQLNYKQRVQSVESEISYSTKKHTLFEVEATIMDARAIPTIGRINSIVNLAITQPLDKEEQWNLKLTVYDAFKQNSELSRTVSGNYIQITQNKLLQRFLMLTLIYKIKSASGNESGGFTE